MRKKLYLTVFLTAMNTKVRREQSPLPKNLRVNLFSIGKLLNCMVFSSTNMFLQHKIYKTTNILDFASSFVRISDPGNKADTWRSHFFFDKSIDIWRGQ